MRSFLAKLRFIYSATVIFLIVAFVMIPLSFFFRKYKGAVMHHANRLIIFLLGSKVLQAGTMNLDADMYIFNHQGIMDIIAMEALQNHHLRWMAKRELFNVFYIGNLLKLGEMIPVDRESKKSIIALLDEVNYSLSTLRRKVAIFPEGTRAKTQKLLPFKSGAKIIAQKLNLKVQPIVIVGSKMLVDQSINESRTSDIVIHFLPLIDTTKADEKWYERAQEDMQEVIDNELLVNNRSR